MNLQYFCGQSSASSGCSVQWRDATLQDARSRIHVGLALCLRGHILFMHFHVWTVWVLAYFWNIFPHSLHQRKVNCIAALKGLKASSFSSLTLYPTNICEHFCWWHFVSLFYCFVSLYFGMSLGMQLCLCFYFPLLGPTDLSLFYCFRQHLVCLCTLFIIITCWWLTVALFLILL